MNRIMESQNGLQMGHERANGPTWRSFVSKKELPGDSVAGNIQSST